MKITWKGVKGKLWSGVLFLLGIAKSLAVKAVTAFGWKWLLGSAVGLWLAVDTVSHVSGPGPPPVEYYKEEFAKLRGDVFRAMSEGFRKDGEYKEATASLMQRHNLEKSGFKHIIDSLQDENKKLVSTSAGQGNVLVSGAGGIKEGKFKDNWLEADVTKNDTGGPHLKYAFQFTLHDVVAELRDEDNKRMQVYSVFLSSIVDPSDVRHIGDYKRERTLLIEDLADTRTWYWNDLAVNADFILNSPTLEGSISLSLFTLTSGGSSANQVIGRLPDVGVSSNLRDSHHLFIGVRLNVGHWLPVFQDLYICPKYAIAFDGRRGFLLGIGTTL